MWERHYHSSEEEPETHKSKDTFLGSHNYNPDFLTFDESFILIISNMEIFYAIHTSGIISIQYLLITYHKSTYSTSLCDSGGTLKQGCQSGSLYNAKSCRSISGKMEAFSQWLLLEFSNTIMSAEAYLQTLLLPPLLPCQGKKKQVLTLTPEYAHLVEEGTVDAANFSFSKKESKWMEI